MQLPYINIRGAKGNAIEKLFWGTLPIERANALVSYRPGYLVGRLLDAIKYQHQPQLAVELGKMMAQELIATDFFEGIDALQAIPLHPNRERKRGYNQSELIAQGISSITGLPIVHYVRRIIDNPSQTLLQHNERRANVTGIFEATFSNKKAKDTNDLRKEPLHILLIDDVITTGATTKSCGLALAEAIPDLRLSVLSFAYAGTIKYGRILPVDLNLPDKEVSNLPFRESQYGQL